MSSLSFSPSLSFFPTRVHARLLGFLSLITPITLYFGGRFGFGIPLEPSFSDYYYTEMKWVFIIQLALPAVLIFVFQDEDAPYAGLFSKIIAISAFLVIIFPTSHVETCPNVVYSPQIAGLAAEWIHFFAAGILFAAYAVLFGYSLAHGAKTAAAKRRFIIVATVIALTMLLSAVNMVLTAPICASYVPESTFYSEVILSTSIFFGWLNYARHLDDEKEIL